jgi:probable F420-dependent oxidoreductase
MKLDASLPPAARVSEAPAIARAAESLGFAGLWSTETQHDPFLPLALAAEHTSRLELGTGIAVSFGRSPATMAYTAWDLAALSQGRFMLGLGTQVKAHIERRFGMPWPDSVTGKLREQILAIRSFWDCWQNGTKLNFRGEHYKLTLMSPFFNPGPIPAFGPPAPDETRANMGGYRGVPIYIAGVNTGLAKLAGELCEGFLPHPLSSERYLREVILPAIEQGAAKAGRTRADVTVAASPFAAVNRPQREFCRQQVSFYASTPSYRPVFELHGWGETAEQLSMHAARGEWTEMPALVTDEMLAAFVTTADTPAELAAALKERFAGVVDRMTLYIPFVPGEQDDFWRELLKAFNG